MALDHKVSAPGRFRTNKSKAANAVASKRSAFEPSSTSHWTKHAKLNAIVQPEQFIEIGEQLAAQKGIAHGDVVRVSSKRGYIKGRAVVTKRIRRLQIDGQTVDQIGIPCHWGWEGATRKGFLALSTHTVTVPDKKSLTFFSDSVSI